MPADSTDLAHQPDPDRPTRRSRLPRDAVLVLFGTLLTLGLYGYRFGEGNHTIYLLDGLRQTDPSLLRNDWFSTQTLQYHALFGLITRNLMQSGLIEPVFAVLYIGLAALLHAGWLGIATRLSGCPRTYILSLAFYYASAAGTGLGFYQFFQDSSFLPSNVANVALLWGIWLWMIGKPIASGACFGVAGMFHLNHAVVGAGLWIVLTARESYRTASLAQRTTQRRIFIGSILALVPSMINALLASRAKLAHSGSIPLEEFIDLYVRLRHPHHYDPSSWPAWLWIAFLWPMPLALAWMIRRHDPASSRARHVFGYFVALQIIALFGAGIWYFSETLVQLSLYRFSIYVQLLACIMAAAWIVVRVRGAWLGVVAAIVCAGMMVACVIRGPFLGVFVMPEDDPDYRELCLWARDNTPTDAVVLVPPGESGFRLHARRAIVVNFKAVPQLSGELPAWRDRLESVLAVDDLGVLPRGYADTLRAIDARYAALSDAQLIAATGEWNAEFIVTPRRLPARSDARLLFSSANGRYFLYDLSREGDGS